MSPKKYEKLRNELIQLLKMAVALDSVNPETQNLLSRICRKTQENQFEIVLAGEFQGGKSTTFNALCDGRELSPTGSGIKTSGCIMSAQNISEADEPESADIQWRSSEDMIAGFSDFLLPHLKNLAPERFRKVTASELVHSMDMAKSADCSLIKQAADMEWKIWKKDKAAYDPEQKGLLDILRCATLAARYYNDDFLKHMRNKEKFSPEAVGNMMVFPQDWEERWLDNNPERFSCKEILFIFIRHIRLRLHSENLMRLGSVIVDCPGLFASRWDTDMAREAMFNADAILYLFDGSKTLKMSDLTALEFIRKNGMEYKLFYGCNMRGQSLENSKRILQASITALKHQGFQINDEDVALFHALLALCSVKGENFLKTELGRDLDKTLYKTIYRQLALLDIYDYGRNAMRGVSQDFIHFAKDVSGIDQLMEMVEKSVIFRKARSILIENGSKVAVNCLMEVEGTFKTREQNALKKENDFRVQAGEVETELRKFKGKCAGILEHIDDSGPDEMLANDIWARLEARQDELCDRAGDRIYREVVNKLSFSLLARKKFQDQITGIIKAEIDECFTETINAWTAEIKDGKNAVYNTQLIRRIHNISRELKTVWNASPLSEMNLLTGIDIPEFSGDMELDSAAIIRELESGHALENIRYNAILAAGGVTGIFTAASGVLIAVYMLITRLFWIRIATVVVFLINIILMFLTRGLIERSLKDEIMRKLSPAIKMLFYEIREDVKNEFKNFSRNIREFYKEIFQTAVNRPQQIFENRRKQAEKDFKETRESRLKIAQKAKDIREAQIQPLRLELEKFREKVEQYLASEE